MHARPYHTTFDLDTQEVFLVSFNPEGQELKKIALDVDFSSLTPENGFLDNKGLLTRTGFLQVNALIAQAIKQRLRMPEDQIILTASCIGDNGESLEHARLGRPDDTASMGGQASVRALPSIKSEGAYTNMTMGILTMNTHGSKAAIKNVFTCTHPHAVDAADVQASVHQTHEQFEYLAANNGFPVVAVHYYVNGQLSYGLGHAATGSNANAVLTATKTGSDITFYESTMFANGDMPGATGHAKGDTANLQQEGIETKSAATPRSAELTGKTITVNHMRPGGGRATINLVAKNLFPQAKAEDFDSGNKKAASSHALCCASSFAWRTAAEGGASGNATGEAKEGAAPYGTFPE